LLLPLALGGCSVFDWLGGTSDTVIPGLHEPVLAPTRGLAIDNPGDVVLPELTRNEAWAQFGATPDHVGGNFVAGLTPAWHADVGADESWRARFTAEPLIIGSQVFTLDTDGEVRGFALADGQRQWRTDTTPPDNDNSAVGGSMGFADGVLYVATGRAELVAIKADSGTILWRVPLPAAGRGGPTFDGGKLFVVTVDAQLLAMSASDGKILWQYQATEAAAGMLAQAAPAVAQGIVVHGFASGDLVALEADTGTVVWSDNLGALKGSAGLAALTSIRGGIVLRDGIVYAIGMGGLMAALDLRSGRRVWQRDVAGANTLWLAGDVLYVCSIEQKDGSVYWVTDLPRFKNPKRTKNMFSWYGPVMASGKLVLVNDQAQMGVVDPLSGKLVSTLDISDAASLRPVIAAGTLFVLTDDGRLTAYR
jgi:outer membrane protein assembly factor BamB